MNLPEWKDKSAYPDPKETSKHQWAWEFLRRNPEYCEDYERLSKLPKMGMPPWNEDTPMEYLHSNPEALPGETIKQWEQRVHPKLKDCHDKGIKVTKEPLHHKIANDWGISAVCDPSLEKPFMSFETSPLRFINKPGSECQSFVSEIKIEDINEVYVRFDISWPIKQQIDAAKEYLKSMQKIFEGQNELQPIKKRNQVENYPAYLRLLDAESSGAEIKAIAQAVYPQLSNEYDGYLGDHQVRSSLKAAKKLRDIDYLYILL